MNLDRAIQQLSDLLEEIRRRRGFYKPPARIDESEPSSHFSGPRLEHLAWMLQEIRPWPEDKREKAMRWLGFVQGALWGMEFVTIEEMKRINMPEGATFDSERK